MHCSQCGAALDHQSDSRCTPDSRPASGQRTAGRSWPADDQVPGQLDSIQLPAAAMSPACCASASSEEADLASSGMNATSELDKDAQFLQALFSLSKCNELSARMEASCICCPLLCPCKVREQHIVPTQMPHRGFV